MSKEDVEKYMEQAEKYKEADELKKQHAEALNELNTLAYQFKSSVSREPLASALSQSDKDTVLAASKAADDFLMNNPEATVEQIKLESKKLQDIAGPIMEKSQGQTGGMGGMPGGMGGSQSSGEKKGPTIEEVD